MPTIPTYQPQVSRTALRTPQQEGISPQAFTLQAEQLQQASKGVAQLGSVLQQIEDRKQEERDASMVLAARSAFKKEEADQLIDAKNRQGMNAWGLSDEKSTWWKETTQRYLSDTENPQQKAALQRVFLESEPTFYSNIKSHEVAEQRRAVNDSAKASIAADINSAVAGHDDPRVVEGAVTSIKRTVYAQQAVNDGWDEERAAQELENQLTTMHRHVIKSKLNENPAAAETYFEQYKDQIAGRDHPEIQTWLKSGMSRVKAQQVVDSLAAKGMNEQAQLDYIRKHLEGDEERDAIAEATTRFSMERAAIERDQQAAREMAHNIILEPGKTWKDIPGELWARLDPADKERMQEGTYGKTTDWPTYYSLRQIAARDPSTFASMDLTPYFGKLDDARRTEMIKLQTKALDSPDDMAIARSKWQIMEQSAAAAGLDPKKAKDDSSNGEKLREYYRRVDDEMMAFQQRTGKEPTKADLLQITDDLARQITYERWGIIPDTERAAALADVEGVPRDMVPELARRVEAAGQPVTDENVQKLYNYLISRGVR